MTLITRVDNAAARTDIWSLPREVISTHILSSQFLHEPADLGRLRAVSTRMRDAVDATGREIKKLSNGEAAHLGYVSLLKDRHSRGLLKGVEEWSLVCAAAARSGDLAELKALRAANFPWDSYTCARAARGGHLETLQWARANGCPWDEWTCSGAAGGGHLETLKWARANGCPWNSFTCANAAEGGHIELLRWARENGAPWTKHTCRVAAAKGYVEA